MTNSASKTDGETNNHGESSLKSKGLLPSAPQADEIVPTIRFQLVHCIYVISVVAACLAIFGVGGVCPSILVLTFWGLVFMSRSRVRSFKIAAAPAFCFILCCGALAPGVMDSREAARRMQCQGHFCQVALALHNYHAVFGSLPPAYIPDENGKPMHSWRVLILPFVEENALFKQYRFDEPWDGPNNRLLAPKIPRTYQCPSQEGRPGWTPTSTTYMAIVGNRAAWPAPGVATLEDFPDRISNTIFFMEGDVPLSNWMEPKDISASEAIEMLSQSDWRPSLHHTDGFFYVTHSGRNVSMVDASREHIPNGIPRHLAENLVLVDDEGKIGNVDHNLWTEIFSWRFCYGNIFRLALLIAIVFFPTPWVWIGDKRGRTAAKLS